MTNNLKCYSHYNPQKSECKSCEFKAYCKDSTKLAHQYGPGVEFEKVAYSESLATPHPSDADPDGGNQNPSKLLAELLWSMHDARFAMRLDY